MAAHRGLLSLGARVHNPWVALCLVLALAIPIVLAVLGRREALWETLLALVLGIVGLAATAWGTAGEDSHPGPALPPGLGILVAFGLTLFSILRPGFVTPPLRLGLARALVGNLLWQFALPLLLLLATRVSGASLGLSNLLRSSARWRQLGVVLVVALTLPALLYPRVVPAFAAGFGWRTLLALAVAYLYALLSQALPEEYLYRQFLQSRLQAVLRQATAAIVLQALLYGLAGAGRHMAAGEPWPLALAEAAVQGGAAGLFYGLLRDRTGSLRLPIFVHAWVGMWAALPQVLPLLGE